MELLTFNDDDELNDSCHSKIDKYADYKYAQANSIGQNLWTRYSFMINWFDEFIKGRNNLQIVCNSVITTKER